MLLASVRFFFLFSVLHTSSSWDHSSFIKDEKMPTSLGKKPNKQNQTNKLSRWKKQCIKELAGAAQNSGQRLWCWWDWCIQEHRLQAQMSKSCTCSLLYSSHFCEDTCCIHHFLWENTSHSWANFCLLHMGIMQPLHTSQSHGPPLLSLTGPSAHFYPLKSLIPGSESVVQFLRFL